MVTLENFGLVLNPFSRELQPMRMMLAGQRLVDRSYCEIDGGLIRESWALRRGISKIRTAHRLLHLYAGLNESGRFRSERCGLARSTAP